mgnify:CR=1 FL=1
MTSLSSSLLKWFKIHGRHDLPWQKNLSPYRVWVSEIMLQQTKVDTVIPYYNAWMKKFPNIESVSEASEESILKSWEGLGYYSRARNLHFTAQYINNELGGSFPNTFESLIKLKGVGDYTASAISSICFGIPQAVVDGNVYRFLSRYFGILTPIDSSSAHKEFKIKAMNLIGNSHPGTFNQAMMEFGSIHCTYKNPKCSSCPFAKKCIALNQNKISRLPVKTFRIKIKKRYFNS